MKPYTTINFNGPPPDDSIINLFWEKYPKLRNSRKSNDQEALNEMYKTEYGFKFGPELLKPYSRPTPSVSYDEYPDPVLRRPQRNPPFSRIAPVSNTAYDPHRGAYEWRDLTPRAGMYIWQPLQKTPILGDAGKRSTMLPVRLKQHDPTHEKERWDFIRHLVRKNSVAYGYRTNMPGYTGHRQVIEDLASCVAKDISKSNPYMVSTTQAFQRGITMNENPVRPTSDFNIRIEPSSRVVTLPYNPSTQRSSCN